MFRVFYHYGERFRYGAWVESKEEAKLETLTHPNPPIGMAITWNECVEGNPDGNMYSYYLREGDILRGVSKSEFMATCGF